MSYSTLLLHMALGQSNEARLSAARNLADRFDALIVGAAACDPQPVLPIDGSYAFDMIQADRSFARDQLDQAEAEFRRGLTGRENRIEWRSAFLPPAPFVARQARAADLVITGAVAPDKLSNSNWRLDPGDLVMQAGRAVLMVPEDYAGHAPAKSIIVAWKDNRESRRAVADALPLARAADRVLVASIVDDGGEDEAKASLRDVVAWLQRHDVPAEKWFEPLVSDPASQLRSLALDEDADLIVTGAYGHSRTREWMLGGVTHDFLTHGSTQCLMMSH